MRKSVSYLSVCAAGLAIASYAYLRRSPTEELVSQTSATERQEITSPRGERSGSPIIETPSYGDSYFVPITGGKPIPKGTIDPFPHVAKSRAGLPLEKDPFVAQSPLEQQWLDQNGYPNAEQMDAYNRAPDAALAQAALHGDGVADVILTQRQLARGDREAAGKLMTAGMNGSSFALSALAGYLSTSRNGNPVMGYALSRVVEMRGDWRAGVSREFMINQPLSSLQRAQAEAEAQKIFDNLRKNSKVQPFVQPRPRPPQ